MSSLQQKMTNFLNDFERVKFTFKSIDKYITMDLNTKIALEDLKFTFSNILKIDLFAKRLEFQFVKGNSKETLNSKQGLGKQRNFELVQSKQLIDIIVNFIEEGA